jgi:site-specific DNA-methyltransferase (adenine-specific)
MIDKFENKIFNLNAFYLLKKIPDKSIDMIFSDPPYCEKTHYGARRNKTVNGLNGKKETTIEFEHFTNKDLFSYYRECERICKGWIINFHADIHANRLKNWLNTKKVIKGLDYIRTGIWDKCNTECPQLTGDRPAQGWEAITMIHPAGKKKWGQKKRKNSVYHYHTVTDSIGSHPTPKPTNLCAEIIMNFSNEGDIVLDAFSGTGNICLAAMRTNRRFIGNDINSEFVENIASLFEKEVNGNMFYQDNILNNLIISNI